MSVQSTDYALLLFFNHGQNGWSETWWVNNPADAADVGYARCLLMTPDVGLTWACLVPGFWPYWSLVIPFAPAYPLDQWGHLETDMDVLFWRFYDDLGNHSRHWIRPFAREDVKDGLWAFRDMQLPPGIPPLPLDLSTATKLQLLQNCFCTLRDKTHFSRRLPNLPDGTPQFFVSQWKTLEFDSITQRRVGRHYQPVSWEAVPRVNAPAFSPCGSVVGVARSCLEMPCRFYVGAAPQGIHFYWAKPGAVALPIKNIFWPSYENREITNGPRTGIITPPHRSQWEEGFEIGDAPGTGYTGTQNDFLGLSSALWTPETPTPSWLLPVCDLPVEAFLLQEDGGLLLQEDLGRIELEGE